MSSNSFEDELRNQGMLYSLDAIDVSDLFPNIAPDYVNNEEQQRVGGARDTSTLDMDKFGEEIKLEGYGVYVNNNNMSGSGARDNGTIDMIKFREEIKQEGYGVALDMDKFSVEITGDSAPLFSINMSEEQQRWGGVRDTGTIERNKFREEIKQEGYGVTLDMDKFSVITGESAPLFSNNNMSEDELRWGGARDTGTIDMIKFREEIKQEGYGVTLDMDKFSVEHTGDSAPLFSINPTQSPTTQPPPTQYTQTQYPPLTHQQPRESVIKPTKAPPIPTPDPLFSTPFNSSSSSSSTLPFSLYTPDNPKLPYPPSASSQSSQATTEGEAGEKKGRKKQIKKVVGVRKLTTSPRPPKKKRSSTPSSSQSSTSSTMTKKGRPKGSNCARRKKEMVEMGMEDLASLTMDNYQEFVRGEIDDWEFLQTMLGTCEALSDTMNKPVDEF